MKRFLTRVTLFLFLVILSYPVYLFIFGSMPRINLPNLSYKLGGYGHLHSRLQEVNYYKNVDILFLGGSQAYRGFDVRVFEKYGFKTFNLGSSAQTPIQTKVLLNRYLSSLNPKLVIYAISPNSLSSDGVESSIDVISNSKNDNFSLKMVMKINHLKTYNALIYDSIREFFRLNSKFSQPMRVEIRRYYIDTYISGGYVEKTTNRYYNRNGKTDESEQEEGVAQKNKINSKQYQLDSLEEIISDFKNKGINYILVRPPVADYRKNNEFDNIMRQYGQYYDFNEILNLSDDYFYDASHLRQEGTEIFSAGVVTLINKYIGILNK